MVFAKVCKDFGIKDDIVIAVIMKGRLFPGRIKAVMLCKEFLVALVEFLQVSILSVKLQSRRLMIFSPGFQ